MLNTIGDLRHKVKSLAINPGQVDMCFMLDTIGDLRHKIESLCDLKKKVQNLGDLVTDLSKKSTSISSATSPACYSTSSGTIAAHENPKTYASITAPKTLSASSVGIREVTILKVVLPAQASSHVYIPHQVLRRCLNGNNKLKQSRCNNIFIF